MSCCSPSSSSLSALSPRRATAGTLDNELEGLNQTPLFAFNNKQSPVRRMVPVFYMHVCPEDTLRAAREATNKPTSFITWMLVTHSAFLLGSYLDRLKIKQLLSCGENLITKLHHDQ